MVHHPGDLFDYEDGKPDARPIDKELPPFVAVPTTAGTGSEVGRSTVISDDESNVKKIIFSPRLLAVRVFLDPDLTLGLPAGVTAATGMDAAHPPGRGLPGQGLSPACATASPSRGCGIAVAQPAPAAWTTPARSPAATGSCMSDEEHREARGLMLNAAMMGGVAFQKGLGVTHSLAHALSTVCDLHHGLANGICIPYAMAFNHERRRRSGWPTWPRRWAPSPPSADGFLRLAGSTCAPTIGIPAHPGRGGRDARSTCPAWSRSPSPTAATPTTPGR